MTCDECLEIHLGYEMQSLVRSPRDELSILVGGYGVGRLGISIVWGLDLLFKSGILKPYFYFLSKGIFDTLGLHESCVDILG